MKVTTGELFYGLFVGLGVLAVWGTVWYRAALRWEREQGEGEQR